MKLSRVIYFNDSERAIAEEFHKKIIEPMCENLDCDCSICPLTNCCATLMNFVDTVIELEKVEVPNDNEEKEEEDE